MLGIVALSALSCGRHFLYDDIHSLPDGSWPITQKERYGFEVADTTATYRIFFHVRNSSDYRYSNLYLFMTTQFPNGNLTRDTLECILALPDGQWTGKGVGKLKENLILLNSGLKFPLPGKYIVDIQHAMREETLVGITDIGIRIEANRH
ncbi:gliding motility lipoprotein GldH [Bacteroidales bacterium]